MQPLSCPLFFFLIFFLLFFFPTKIYQGRRLPPGGQCIFPPFSPTSLLPPKTCTRCQTREAREEPRRRTSRPSILFGLGTVLVGLCLYFLFYFSPRPSRGGSRGCKNGHRRTKLDPVFYLIHRREGRDLPKELGEEEKKQTTRRSEQRTVRWDLMFSRSAPSQPSQELAALPPPLRGPLTLISTSGPSHPATRKPPESPFVRTASLLLRLFFPSLSPVDCNTPSLFCLVYNISLI